MKRMAGVDLVTPGAIPNLLRGNFDTLELPVVQVIGFRCFQNALYEGIILSDGSVCEEAMIDINIHHMIKSNKLHKGSIVQLTRVSFSPNTPGSYYIIVKDLKVIRSNCIIPGDQKPSSEEDYVAPDVNDADEPMAPKQKRSSCSQTKSRKRQRQSSDNKEDGEIGACFEKLEKLGWEEGPMYDTAVLLFGESSDYRKIWLHLKPKSSLNWVKNAGGKYGLLG